MPLVDLIFRKRAKAVCGELLIFDTNQQFATHSPHRGGVDGCEFGSATDQIELVFGVALVQEVGVEHEVFAACGKGCSKTFESK